MSDSTRRARTFSVTTTAIAVTIHLLAATAVADTIAIIGTGRVASALGPQFAKQGHRIIYGSREPDRDEVRDLVARTHETASALPSADAVRQADIVVLAVPWTAAEAVVKSLGDLSGKIVIDPTNPYNRGEAGLARLVVETSAGELIQGWAPGAKVVKAFNTMSSTVMADPASAGGPVTVPMVGDDDEAKAKVATIIEGMGLEVIDLGPIRYAHVVEGMLVVWANARFLGHPFNFYLRPQP
jgi:hypothetical protein